MNCLLCLLESRLRELYKVRGLYPDLVRKFLRELSELDLEKRTNVFIHSFDLVVKLSGVDDPHREEKLKLYDRFLKVYNIVREQVQNLEDAFKFAVNANLLDVEMHDYRPDLTNVHTVLTRDVKVLSNESLDICSFVKRFRRVCYVLDNSGEHVFDIALADMLHRRNINVLLLVREEPYEIDVTREIVEDTLERFNIDIDVVEICGRCPPVLYAVKEFDSSDTLIISKGIANLEAYIDWCVHDPRGNVLFLLVAKCGPIARFLGVEKGSGVVATSDYINSRARVYSHGREVR
ncbi:MAG: DUF89 family protein [Crenarchaeota archaeon]|nr:DUF89 family protein [Thermoproteota archaeon]